MWSACKNYSFSVSFIFDKIKKLLNKKEYAEFVGRTLVIPVDLPNGEPSVVLINFSKHGNKTPKSIEYLLAKLYLEYKGYWVYAESLVHEVECGRHQILHKIIHSSLPTPTKTT